jgi:tetratricopeptide (TPR) repeat protein
MRCPVCRAVYRAPQHQAESLDDSAHQILCRRCGADLTSLIHLHDQALWHHHQAIVFFRQRNYAQARVCNDWALALHSQQPNFHALAGQLWALEGNFAPAIAAWCTALHLDPENITAKAGLQLCRNLRENPRDEEETDTIIS